MWATSLLDRILFGPDEPSRMRRAHRSASVLTAQTEDPLTPAQASEKKPYTTVTELESAESLDESLLSRSHPFPRLWRAASRRPEATWQPSLIQVRPYVGIIALCVAVACIFAAGTVLVVSDGQPIDEWPVQPTVYLAIATAVANSCLALAHLEATPISWWYSATRGRTIGSLERQWQVSRSLVQAVLHCRGMSIVSLACIAGSLVIIDGPLLSPYLRRFRERHPSSERIARRTSRFTSPYPLSSREDSPGMQLITESIRRATTKRCGMMRWLIDPYSYQTLDAKALYVISSECELPRCPNLILPKCRATIEGPGVAKRNCSSRTWSIDPQMLVSMNSSWGSWKEEFEALVGSRMSRLPAFSIDIDASPNNKVREASSLEVGYLQFSEELIGSYVLHACELVPATMAYDVNFTSNSVDLPPAADQGRFLRLANNTTPVDWSITSGRQPTTMTAPRAWMSISKNVNTSVALSAARAANSSYGLDMMSMTPVTVKYLQPEWLTSIGIHFEDPTADLIHDFNKLLLRCAAMTGGWSNLTELVDRGVATNQTILAAQTTTENVFRTNMAWFCAAAAVQAVAIVCILPMFHKFWSLGCHLTLSPFSTALALDAPLLRQVISATGSRSVVEELGNLKIKLGVVSPSATGAETADGYATGRLGLGREQNVVKPRSDVKFYA